MKVKISMDKVSLQSKPKENKIVETRLQLVSHSGNIFMSIFSITFIINVSVSGTSSTNITLNFSCSSVELNVWYA